MTTGDVDDDTVLSAVVACRRPGASTPAGPVSADVERMLPERERLEAVEAYFAGLGFDTTPPFAGAFSITAPRWRFVDVFDAVEADRFSDTWLSSRSDAELELPLDRLAEVLGEFVGDVDAIFFTPAPDFGPGNP